ncbi:hypothetical protein LG634_34940 [Streptomyces bambusae]|uniref:hypothetical protein n=1 Tax=Streptomyces bambusae TaxID=1550616 RepID=UPI001CFF78B4|nr:hypothetical protein [Streptomyces bambusae]MCB5169986.1 hypothetical protein [Streptomyces bambusae]
MTQTAVPSQPPGPPSGTGGAWGDPQLLGKPPTPPTASEAGRLLCAGTYLDGAFRDRVIDELYVHEERMAAPSYGYDAARVLAHALRARRTELAWAGGIVGLWFVGILLTEGRLLLLLNPCLLLSLAAWLTPRTRDAGIWARFFVFVLRLWARLYFAFTFLTIVTVAFGAGEDSGSDSGSGSGYYGESSGLFGSDNPYEDPDLTDVLGDVLMPASADGLLSQGAAWGVLAFFAGIGALKWLSRHWQMRTIATDLAPKRYPELAADPAEQASGTRFRTVQRRIRTEQHWPLVMYGVGDPFCGAGLAFKPWHLTMELRPRKDAKPQPLDNAGILRRVVPLVEALRVPSAHGSPQAAAAVLDRLRELVVDECVFLPAQGLLHRDQGPYTAQDFGTHRAGSIEEGGERRRHFLRIRVGGWDENVVVTVFVRVHTQGGMLMLEVAPHVLPPVRGLFQDADAAAQRYLNNNHFGKAVWAAVHTPRALGTALATLGHGLLSAWRILTEGNGGARPTGPELSVRELGAELNASLFQDMDVDRYLRTIEDRVANGVKLALREAGWQTDEIEQKIINLAAGSTYVDSMNNSAVNFGANGTANNTNQNKGGGSGK